MNATKTSFRYAVEIKGPGDTWEVIGSSNDKAAADQLAEDKAILAITRVVDTKEAEERAEKAKRERMQAAARAVVEKVYDALAAKLTALGCKVEFGKINNYETGETREIDRVDDTRVSVSIEHTYSGDGVWARKTGKKAAKVSINYDHLANYPQNKDGGFNLDKMAARIAEAVKAKKEEIAREEERRLAARNGEALANEIKAEFGIDRYSSILETKYGKLNLFLHGLDADGARKALTVLKEAGLIK